MQFDIVRVDDPGLIQQIGRLRAEVWLAEGKLLEAKVANGIWFDELDDYEGTAQYAALHQGEVVAAARLSQHFTVEEMPHAEDFATFDLHLQVPYGYISRLVVRKDFRGHGLARRFDVLRLQDASKQGATSVLALPLPYRVEPLKKLGFVYFGVSSLSAQDRNDNGLQVPVHIMAHYMENLPPLELVEQRQTEP